MAGHREPGTLFGHPVGLFVLFVTEMWERFSYYGMRALLILYMTNYFLWPQDRASRVYKWYTALVYFTPLLGGFLADRYLGNKRAVIIGAVLMAIGHFLMAFETHWIFYSALVFLIFGNGFFKPNMSTQVGRLYPVGDPRRDSAYTIFYMGINTGAFLAPMVCGTLGEAIHPHWGFTAAGVGMVLGLLVYVLGYRWVIEVSGGQPRFAATAPQPPEESNNDKPAFGFLNRAAPYLVLGLAAIAAAIGIWFLCTYLFSAKSSDLDQGIFCVLISIAMGILTTVLFKTHGTARDRTLAIGAVAVFIIAFWFAFEQAGNSLTVWADKFTNRFVFNFGEPPVPTVELPAATKPVTPPPGILARLEMPASWFQAINPLLIVLLAPILAWLWVWLGRRQLEPSTPAKMAIGVFLVGMSFVAMVFAGVAENRPSETKLAAMPSTIPMKQNALGYRDKHDELHAFAAGRLTYDAAAGTLHMKGVLPDTERDRVLGESSPEAFKKKVKELVEKSEEATKKSKKSKGFQVEVVLDRFPEGFDMRWTTLLDEIGFDREKRAIVANRKIARKDEKSLLKASENVLDKTAAAAFKKIVRELRRKSKEAAAKSPLFEVSVDLPFDPGPLEARWRELQGAVWFEEERSAIVASRELAERDEKLLLLAGADPALRAALFDIYRQTYAFRVSVLWLFLNYILATIGEICLSPVGLSMVSKLAPAVYATLLMGLWNFNNFFANFLAGFMGEFWGKIPPIEFFMVFVGVAVGLSIILAVLVNVIRRLMHGVH